jgi:hypothetical protein
MYHSNKEPSRKNEDSGRKVFGTTDSAQRDARLGNGTDHIDHSPINQLRIWSNATARGSRKLIQYISFFGATDRTR